MEVYVVETLKRAVDVDSDSTQEALAELEKQYNDGDVTLDYGDLCDVGFSTCGITRTELLIMDEVHAMCAECVSKDCLKYECVAFRIRKLVLE